MAKLSIMLAIVVSVWASTALADDIVRIRSDGKIIDETGKIIAVPDRSDSRNSDYEKYYKSLGKNGEPVKESDFYIITDPLKGLVRINLGESQAQTNQPEQNGMVRKYDGSQQLIKSPDAPIYNDSNNGIRTVY